MSYPDRDQLLDIVRSNNGRLEIQALKAKISVLEHQIGWLRAENIGLRAELRRAGIQSITDIPVVR